MIKKICSLFVLFFLLFPASALAQDGAKEPQVTALPADEVVDRGYFAASEIVEVSGTVNGDVYVAGGQVLVDGIVNGDLLVAGGAVTVSGNISGNIRAAGGQVLVTGTVGENATIAGGSIEITDTAVLSGNLVVGAGSVVLNAPVSGDINAGVGNLRLGSSAVVGGDINYASDEEISTSETASVSGTINRTRTPEFEPPSEEAISGFFAGVDLFAKLSSLITSLVIGLLMIRFLPNYTKGASDTIAKKFLPSLALGFTALVVVPVLVVVLFMTLLGIPLAFLLGAVFILYLYIVRIFAMVAIGEKIAEWAKLKTSMYWVFIVGLVAYYVLTLIPVLGWIIKLLVLVASFGAALMNEKATWRKASNAKVV